MSTDSVIEGVVHLAAELEAARAENREMRANMVDARQFYNAPLTTRMVADLHGVTPALVRKYIEAGYIPLHPLSSSGKLLVRGSDALTLDFKRMRYK